LRERREDIPALLAFLAGGTIQIDLPALTALILHDHPLNVRGLSGVNYLVRSATIILAG